MFDEKDLLPLSALQHLLFCERQCALIHIERQWKDNHLTIEGSYLHNNVDENAPRREVRGDMALFRGLSLQSLRLGLVGRADMIEMHRDDSQQNAKNPNSINISGLPGKWIPFPVEYKRGKPKHDKSDMVQLCAQALCLEEMLKLRITKGALFYGRTQKRLQVDFDTKLRELTVSTASRLHELINNKKTPRAQKAQKCNNCSMIELCMPEVMTNKSSAKKYIERMVRSDFMDGLT